MVQKNKNVIYKTKRVCASDFLAYVEWKDGVLDSKRVAPAFHGYEIAFVFSGTCSHHFGTGDVVKIGNGDVSFLNYMEPHRCITSKRGRLIGYNFNLSDKDISKGRNPRLFSVHKDSLEKLKKRIPELNKIKRIVSWIRDDKPMNQSEVDGYFLELLSACLDIYSDETIESEKTDNRQLRKLREFIVANYNKKLCLDQMTDVSAMSKFHMIRKFKEKFGVSPVEYMHCVRASHAMKMLLGTDMKIEDVGYEVGFEDLSFFLHKFKNLYGKSPGMFRT